MSVPGTNVLALALSVQGTQEVGYLRFLAKTTNDVGKDVPTYEDRVDLWGSFQPVSAAAMQLHGLELGKSWAIFYASQQFQDMTRDDAPDLLLFNGRRWEIKGKTGWFAQDGWDAALCVDVGPDA
jgi:hypothetical protein